MEERTLVFATNNTHKLEELRAIAGNSFRILSLQEIGCNADIPETANTLQGNALQKAQYVKEHFGYDCFADDTGLEIEALNGEPGVYSARYGGEPSNSTRNMNKVLSKLAGITNRKAAFKTVIALLLGEKCFFFEGSIQGDITTEPIGKNGFGYDPIFKPKGYNHTFSELTNETKNKISHRALAVEKLMAFLMEFHS